MSVFRANSAADVTVAAVDRSSTHQDASSASKARGAAYLVPTYVTRPVSALWLRSKQLHSGCDVQWLWDDRRRRL